MLRLSSFVLAGLALAVAPLPARAADVDPAVMVDAFEGVGGKHAGKRRSGAKGFCAAGEFVGNGAGTRLSNAAHFAAGAKAPAIARFSIGGGNPAAPDTGIGTRGLALALDVPGGDDHHFVFITAPVFGARTPESLLELLQSRAPDPATGRPDAQRVAAANAKYPEAANQGAFLRDNPPPASYATAPYFGVNTFILTNAAGAKQPVRMTFEPVAGRVALTAEQRQSMPADFLHAEFVGRVAKAPAEWALMVVLPKDGDPLLDATAAWPTDRQQIEVGRLRITGATPVGQVGECEAMMFDPTRLPAGIDASDDPILLGRSAPYAVSLSRRTQ